MPGSAAGSSTPRWKRGPRIPSVPAARSSTGSTDATPSSVAMAMASSEPITTTKRMATSERPNQSMASGSQQMDGSACMPITSGRIPRRTSVLRARRTPSGTPSAAAAP